jgi:hypothetical protein
MYSINRHEKGNILFLILIAVVLLAALSYVIAKPGGDSVVASSANRISEGLKSQAAFFRSGIIECPLINNYGYPVQPGSGLAKDTQCEINDTPTYQDIFKGQGGRFAPQPITPFGDWTYTVNGATTPPSISISVTKAMNCANDVTMKSAMDQIAMQFTTGEATIVCDGSAATFTLYIVKGT